MHQGNTDKRKNLEKKFIFQLGSLNPHSSITYWINSFDYPNLLCTSAVLLLITSCLEIIQREISLWK